MTNREKLLSEYSKLCLREELLIITLPFVPCGEVALEELELAEIRQRIREIEDQLAEYDELD